MSDNPMVALNHAIACAWCTARPRDSSCSTALDADERLAGHHRLDAVRAHLLELAGDAGGHRSLPAGRRADDEPAGAKLPDYPGGASAGSGPEVRSKLIFTQPE